MKTKTRIPKDAVTLIVIILAYLGYLVGNSIGLIFGHDYAIMDALKENFPIPTLVILLGLALTLILRIRTLKNPKVQS